MSVSEAYERLTKAKAEALWPTMCGAWTRPEIVAQQQALADQELAAADPTRPPLPYGAFAKVWRRIAPECKSLLEVGCAQGYYVPIIRAGAVPLWDGTYAGIDVNVLSVRAAQVRFPGECFAVGTGAVVKGQHDCVVDGSVLVGVVPWAALLESECKAAGRYLILHRLPVLLGNESECRFWRKAGYGVPMLEVHFGTAELFAVTERMGFVVRVMERVYPGTAITDPDNVTMLLERLPT